MKVTVCELTNEMDTFEEEWLKLIAHVRSNNSELVLLPEMPFYRWVAQTDQVDAEVWQKSVEMHDYWISRLTELAPAIVMGSRPVIRKGKRLNEAFVWDEVAGYRAVHHKYYLPDEEGWWEVSWYERGDKDFSVFQSGEARIGFLICTELWFNSHAQEYAKQDIELLACPRATNISSVDKWIAGGRAAAVVSGAYCLSSNFSYAGKDSFKWGGNGWIIEPENGTVLGTTSRKHPFLTFEIDLSLADAAKLTYPRYVID